MRPVAVGRKNWIHIGTAQAGPKVAAILSVVETCRRLQTPVRAYLAEVLPGLSDPPIQRVANLTPKPGPRNTIIPRYNPAHPSTVWLLGRVLSITTWTSSRSDSIGGDQKAAASSSFASCSKRWQSSPFPWIESFTRNEGQTETTICRGWGSQADTHLAQFSGILWTPTNPIVFVTL